MKLSPTKSYNAITNLVVPGGARDFMGVESCLSERSDVLSAISKEVHIGGCKVDTLAAIPLNNALNSLGRQQWACINQTCVFNSFHIHVNKQGCREPLYSLFTPFPLRSPTLLPSDMLLLSVLTGPWRPKQKKLRESFLALGLISLIYRYLQYSKLSSSYHVL